MRVGDYVRTKFGQIGKLENIGEYNINIGFGEHIQVIAKTGDYKSSSNILDLIEPMDLLYIDIEYGFAGGIVVPKIYETQAELDEEIEKLKSDKRRKLVGIITKEQLEHMMHEVE